MLAATILNAPLAASLAATILNEAQVIEACVTRPLVRDWHWTSVFVVCRCSRALIVQ